MTPVAISDFIAGWTKSPFADLSENPWSVVQHAATHIRSVLATLGTSFHVKNDVAIHNSATVETNAQLKGPIIIGPKCFVASGAYLRGGVYLEKDCIIGSNSELKTSFMFEGSKIAHLNFVGDSIIGSAVNIEAGAIIANYRNEFEDKAIRIAFEDDVIETDVEKFGALVGDSSRIGANAVVAPGALLPKGFKIGRLAHVDQYPHRFDEY